MKFFMSFRDWKNYILSAIRNVFIGLCRIVWAIGNGLVSLIAGIIRSTFAFSRREPKAMIVIVILYVVLLLIWLKWG